MILVRMFRLAALLSAVIAVSGCSTFTSTTDGVAVTVEGITDTTSSTTDLVTPDSDGKAAAFVSARFEILRYEAARGSGENLVTLAALLGEPDPAHFALWMKNNYDDLFAGLAHPRELLARIEYQRGRLG